MPFPCHLGFWSPRLLGAFMLLCSTWAQADLMLYPTRVVFDKNLRAAQVELVNRGSTPETYRINVVNRRMSETGEFAIIKEPGPGEQFADTMLRYSPRQVTIPPGGSQTVRIMLRTPAGLPDGEYRSHLNFERVADTVDANSIDQQLKNDGKKVGVVLNALVGASIPVIVRQGETASRVSLSDLALSGEVGSASMLAFQIHREGNRSVYGDLVATFTPKGGEAQEVGKVTGVAVYVPNALRRVQLPLRPPAEGEQRVGTYGLIFRERPEAGGKTMAEVSLPSP
jgi:fimbrial chaperone protein